MKAAPMILAVSLAFVAAACTKSDKPEPQVASSASEAGYAQRYVEELDNVGKTFTAQESHAKLLIESFEEYPGELEEPSWPHVMGVVERADAAGRSASYVSRVERLQSVVAFFDEQKEPLTKRVGGAVQYEAKRKNYDFDAYSAAAHGLEKGVAKQVEESLRERNEAHLYIEHEEDALGKKNVEKLAGQADGVAQASYLVHIGIVRTKNLLQPLMDDASDVKATLDRVVEESKAIATDENRSDDARKAATERAAAAEESKGQIDTRLGNVEQLQKEIDDRIGILQAEYQKALDALKEQIRQNATSSGGGES